MTGFPVLVLVVAKIAALAAAKLESDGEDITAPLSASGAEKMDGSRCREKLRVVNFCQAR
jgi:hypothetical protein